MLSHGYYFAAARAYREGGWILPGDRVFTALPLFHGSGQIASLVPALANRASICLEPEFRASTFIQRAVEEGATMLFGIGAMGMAVLASEPGPADGQGEFRLAAWMPMAEEHQRAFEHRFGRPGDGRGIWAIGMPTGHCERYRRVPRPQLDGPSRLALRGGDRRRSGSPRGRGGGRRDCRARPRTRGDVQGYWKDPESTVAAFRCLWYHTGDLAKRSETGFIHFVWIARNT
jgi:crotonobetaine/carnitine-CoA ligase